MQLRVAAYGIAVDKRGLLLAHWNVAGASGWTLPGGGIDPGEDPADAVVRECREETGYRVEVLELLGIDSLVLAGADRLPPATEPIHGLRIVYRVAVTGGELQYEAAGSTDRAAWIALPDVADLDRVQLVDLGLRMAGLS